MGTSIAPARSLAAAWVLAVLAFAGACDRHRAAPSIESEAAVIERSAARASTPAPEAPVAAAAPSCDPEPPLVGCAGWVGSVTATGCLLVWSDCSDGQVREVRCEKQGDHQTCHCVLAGSQISTFESPTFCAPGGQSPSVDRALYTDAVRRQCGWRLGARAPTPAR